MENLGFGVCFHGSVLASQLCPPPGHPRDCRPSRLLCPWNSPGKNTGVGDFPGGPMAKTLKNGSMQRFGV